MHQSAFDIAIQEHGTIESIFDLLTANPGLTFDSDIVSGTLLNIEGDILNHEVVDYYKKYDISPATGNIDGLVEFTKDDGGMITKTYNYSLSGGNNTFNGIRLFNLNKDVTIQINYTGINAGINVFIDSSLDDVNYNLIPGAEYTLDSAKVSHTFSIMGLTTSYIRLRVANGSTGTIDKMIIEV
jgi:hypothetical protein